MSQSKKEWQKPLAKTHLDTLSKELFLGKLRRGDEGCWCLRKWVQWSPSIGGAKCGCLHWTKEMCGSSGVCISFSRSGYSAVVLGVLVCMHTYMLYVCAYMCVCMCVYEHAYMYISACVYVRVYTCMCIHVYMYVYACLCMDFESQ